MNMSESVEKCCIKLGFAALSGLFMIKKDSEKDTILHLLGKMKNNVQYNRYFTLASTLETYCITTFCQAGGSFPRGQHWGQRSLVRGPNCGLFSQLKGSGSTTPGVVSWKRVEGWKVVWARRNSLQQDRCIRAVKWIMMLWTRVREGTVIGWYKTPEHNQARGDNV